jgi:hypothetical protein
MKETDIILNILNRLKRIFIRKESLYVLLIFAFMYFLKYITQIDNLFTKIDPGLNQDVDSESEDISINNINKTFKKYCGDIIEKHAEYNINLNKISGYLQSLLKILILYMIFSGLYTYLIVPYLMNSEYCNLKRLYKYGFRYICFPALLIPIAYLLASVIPGMDLIKQTMPNLMGYSFFATPGDFSSLNGLLFGILYLIFSTGFVMERNQNVTDIFNFKTFGRPSKLISTTFYLISITVYLVYVGLSYYLINKYSENNCYMLKNIIKLKNPLYSNEEEEILESMKTDTENKKNITIHTFILIFITFIIYGFYTDIFDSTIKLFSSKSTYIRRMDDALRCSSSSR